MSHLKKYEKQIILHKSDTKNYEKQVNIIPPIPLS